MYSPREARRKDVRRDEWRARARQMSPIGEFSMTFGGMGGGPGRGSLSERRRVCVFPSTARWAEEWNTAEMTSHGKKRSRQSKAAK
jgi:hypothetical protein